MLMIGQMYFIKISIKTLKRAAYGRFLFYFIRRKKAMDKPKYNIIVIGAGGTGTYFLKEFSRFLCGTSSVIESFSIFDGDVVENKTGIYS